MRVSRNPSNFKPSPLLALELEPVRNHGDEFRIRGLSLGVGDGVAEVLLEEKSLIFNHKIVIFEIFLRNTPNINFEGFIGLFMGLNLTVHGLVRIVS